MNKNWLKIKMTVPLLVLALFAGSALSLQAESWKVDVPEMEFFEHIYANDAVNKKYQSKEKYMDWVHRFYHGYQAISGWNDISAEVLGSTEADRHAVVAEKMNYLGRIISAEWAKDNPDRLIDSRAVSAWSDAAYEAAERKELESFIDKLMVDIDLLFEGRLETESINIARYYASPSEDDWMSNFF